MNDALARGTRWIPLVAPLLLLVGGALARTAQDDPMVELVPLEGPVLQGRLETLAADALTLRPVGAASARTFRPCDVRELRFLEARPPAEPGRRLRAGLVAGDVLVGPLLGPASGGVRLDVPGVGPVDLSFDVLRVIETLPAEADPCYVPASKHLPATESDVAYDTAYDEYRGTVLEATAEGLEIEGTRGRRRSLPWSKLSVLKLLGEPLPEPEGLQAELELVNGTRLVLAAMPVRVDRGLQVTSRSLPDVAHTVAWDAVRALRLWGERFVPATTLPFQARYTHYYGDGDGVVAPWMHESWFGATVDRRIDGCPLRVGGLSFRRGFGVHGHTRIEIPLGGRFQGFQCGFGVDDGVLSEAGASLGNVDGRVLGDGKVLWEAKGVQGGQAVRDVGPLDVTGVATLVLEVDHGSGVRAHDRADWVEPLLVRK